MTSTAPTIWPLLGATPGVDIAAAVDAYDQELAPIRAKYDQELAPIRAKRDQELAAIRAKRDQELAAIRAKRTEQDARRVFAHLGVTQAKLRDPGLGYSHCSVGASIPAIGADVDIVIERPPAPPSPADVEALVAEVDAARAAADEDEPCEYPDDRDQVHDHRVCTDAGEDDDSAHRALVSGLLGALAESQAAIDAADDGEDEDDECEGHESLRGDLMGEAFYCDGSCRRAGRRAVPA